MCGCEYAIACLSVSVGMQCVQFSLLQNAILFFWGLSTCVCVPDRVNSFKFAVVCLSVNGGMKCVQFGLLFV